MTQHPSAAGAAPLARGKTIAFFIPSIEGGGVERNLVNLCRGFLAIGYAADVLYCRATQAFHDQLPAGVRLVQLATPASIRLAQGRAGVSFAAQPALFRYLRNTPPSALIAMQSSAVAVWAWRLAGRPATLVVRESNTPTAAMQDLRATARAVLWLKRWSYPQSDAVVANSQGAADDLARVLGVARERVEVVYNPTYDPSIAERARVPLDHPWFQAGQPPVVLGSGRLVPQKDFASLLRAFAQLRQKLPARLVIIGEGAERSALEQLACELGIAADLALPGFVANPYQYMARAAVFALSSRYEGLPNVLIEAAGLGLPIAAFDCPSGPREILLGGRAGVLAPLGDIAALAAGIGALLENRALADDLAVEGRRQIGRFSPQAGVGQYIEIIERSSARRKATRA